MAMRRTLKDAIAIEFLHTAPKGKSFDRLVSLILEVLPDNVVAPTIRDSVSHLLGTHIDENVLDEVCWRIAGNVKRLRQRHPVPPWKIQRIPEWVPVQITACKREKTTKGNMGALFQFRALAGTSASRTMDKFWSLKFCRYIAPDLGFSKFQRQRPMVFPYTAPEQLVGLRLSVQVTPELSGTSPGFTLIGYSPSFTSFNKNTLGCRFRTIKEFKCVMDLTPEELPCHHCPVGFTKCRAGTHRNDWVKQECPKCKEEEAFFDVDRKSDVCVDCQRQAAYKSEK